MYTLFQLCSNTKKWKYIYIYRGIAKDKKFYPCNGRRERVIVITKRKTKRKQQSKKFNLYCHRCEAVRRGSFLLIGGNDSRDHLSANKNTGGEKRPFETNVRYKRRKEKDSIYRVYPQTGSAVTDSKPISPDSLSLTRSMGSRQTKREREREWRDMNRKLRKYRATILTIKPHAISDRTTARITFRYELATNLGSS